MRDLNFRGDREKGDEKGRAKTALPRSFSGNVDRFLAAFPPPAQETQAHQAAPQEHDGGGEGDIVVNHIVHKEVSLPTSTRIASIDSDSINVTEANAVILQGTGI